MLSPHLISADFVGVFVNDEGRIVDELKCSAGLEKLQSRDGLTLVPGEYEADHIYFVNGRATPRPVVLRSTSYEIEADGTDCVSIAVPNGTEIREGEWVVVGVVDDGKFEFASSIPGTFRFQLRPPFPFKLQMLEVRADASRS